MAKQIYIDENGNENLVSGTINTGKLLPMSTTDPTKVADRIEACETAISGKADTSTFAPKNVSTASAITVTANNIDTQDFTVNDSTYKIVVGFQLGNSINFAMVQCYFENTTTIRTRVRNLANTSDSYTIKVFYI